MSTNFSFGITLKVLSTTHSEWFGKDDPWFPSIPSSYQFGRLGLPGFK